MLLLKLPVLDYIILKYLLYIHFIISIIHLQEKVEEDVQ